MSKKKLFLLTGAFASSFAIAGMCVLSNHSFPSLVDAVDDSHMVYLDYTNVKDIKGATFKLVETGGLVSGEDFTSLTCGISKEIWAPTLGSERIVSIEDDGSFYLEFDFSYVKSIKTVILEGDIDAVHQLTFGEECLHDGVFRIEKDFEFRCFLQDVVIKYYC